MKKDGIQTRNRKLSAKSKKKRGSMVDFFAPFDTKSFSAYGGMTGTSSYLTSPMSQYYGTPSAMAATQFMSASPTSMAASMYSSAGHMAAHALQQHHSQQTGSMSPTTAQNFASLGAAAGGNAISPSIIGAI